MALSSFIVWKIVLCFKANRRVVEEEDPVFAYQNLLEQERVIDEEQLVRAGMLLRSGRALSKEAAKSDQEREADESDPEINFV